jgi:DNA polymerase III epsilon subunit-like protein
VTIVFLDTETTGLADNCDVWEIGLISRSGEQETERWWQMRPDMSDAEPTGLRIGRYYQRIGDLVTASGYDGCDLLNDTKLSKDEIFAEVAGLLDGATIVGAVPWFDTQHLSRMLRRYDQCGTWNYHLVDVETLAAGALRLAPPWNFDKLLAEFGLEYDEADRHTALGDARMVRDLYDAVMSRK